MNGRKGTCGEEKNCSWTQVSGKRSVNGAVRAMAAAPQLVCVCVYVLHEDVCVCRRNRLCIRAFERRIMDPCGPAVPAADVFKSCHESLRSHLSRCPV